MLDLSATDEVRAKIVADTRAAVEAGGTLIGYHDWGTRAMTYEIEHRKQAEYHLLQFHATPDLLAALGRTLRITDGVVRHRIIKLAPGTPDAPRPPASEPASSARSAAPTHA
ncbi:MAG: small subunit ribosomal protein [Solirubrobacteraceae bacterium]|jgi:small subunit ribosomal protein S6|nr:small subunit ribosomal protein [Solirubrobacteraceae bacterium]